MLEKRWAISSESFGCLLRALEHQVLEQVRHARLAVGLVPGSHEIGHVHRDGLLRVIREEQHAEAVREGVLRDAFDGGDPLRLARSAGGGGECEGGGDGQRGDEATELRHGFLRWREELVPRTGFEPVISALRGRRPEPLDERGTSSPTGPSGPRGRGI